MARKCFADRKKRFVAIAFASTAVTLGIGIPLLFVGMSGSRSSRVGGSEVVAVPESPRIGQIVESASPETQERKPPRATSLDKALRNAMNDFTEGHQPTSQTQATPQVAEQPRPEKMQRNLPTLPPLVSEDDVNPFESFTTSVRSSACELGTDAIVTSATPSVRPSRLAIRDFLNTLLRDAQLTSLGMTVSLGKGGLESFGLLADYFDYRTDKFKNAVEPVKSLDAFLAALPKGNLPTDIHFVIVESSHVHQSVVSYLGAPSSIETGNHTHMTRDQIARDIPVSWLHYGSLSIGVTRGEGASTAKLRVVKIIPEAYLSSP